MRERMIVAERLRSGGENEERPRAIEVGTRGGQETARTRDERIIGQGKPFFGLPKFRVGAGE